MDIINTSKSSIKLRELESKIKERIAVPDILKDNIRFVFKSIGVFLLEYRSNVSSDYSRLHSTVRVTFRFELLEALNEDTEDYILVNCIELDGFDNKILPDMMKHYIQAIDLLNSWLILNSRTLYRAKETCLKYVTTNGPLELFQSGQMIFFNGTLYEKVNVCLCLGRFDYEEADDGSYYMVYFYDELSGNSIKETESNFSEDEKEQAEQFFDTISAYSQVYFFDKLNVRGTFK
jgi:hypothetical protein